MTIFFVLATLVLLVTMQWFFTRQRRREADRARSAVRFIEVGPSAQPAEDVLFHPGHTWVQQHGDGLASVGVTAFAGNFAGQIDRVELPSEGRRIHQAEPGWSLVSKGGRRLDLAMPIEGRVLAINPEVVRDPTLLQRRPYDLGWILRVKPRDAAGSRRNLFSLSAAQAWIDAARNAVTSRLANVSTVTAYDGGEWVPGFGEWLEDRDWLDLREDLFPELPDRTEHD
jgi:glycine cleavage system H protein